MKTVYNWPDCPFCFHEELISSYSSVGTTLYCEGCGGSFTFPCFEQELEYLIWEARRRKNIEDNDE